MKVTWVLLYFHCAIAFACGGLAIFQSQWQTIPQLTNLAASLPGQCLYLTLVLSCFIFPLAVTYSTVGRMSPRWWWPVVIVDAFLGLGQFAAVLASYPVRN
jgi:hypothetical protein